MIVFYWLLVVAAGCSAILAQGQQPLCPRFCSCFFANASVVCSMVDGRFPATLPDSTRSLSLMPSSNKIRFMFIHSSFASSSYPNLRNLELRMKAKDKNDRIKLRIHQGAFSRNRFPMLKTFSINGGDVLSLSSSFLLDAPDLISLDLSDLLIKELQPDSFVAVRGSLSNLNLSRNSLVKIDNTSFSGLTSLQRLDLSHNKLTTIHPNAFVDLLRLGELYLQGNKLTVINVVLGNPPPPPFLPTSLVLLDMSDNSKLAVLPYLLFEKAKKLKKLKLNRILFTMNQQQFQRVLKPLAATLEELELEGSLTKTPNMVGPTTLRGFKLSRLSLVGNKLTSLDIVASPDASVETLAVDNNNLTCMCLSNGTINRSIRHITATGNAIVSLSNAHLRSFPSVRSLNLSKNTLRHINDSAFASLPLLNKLDLSNNSLRELPRSAFLASSFPLLKNIANPSSHLITAPPMVVPRLSQVRLRVHGNPFHCNADLLWLKELYDRMSGDELDLPVNDPSCASPYPPAAFSRLAAANFRSFQPTARILNGPKNFTAAEGDALNLTCEVFGDPSPRVIWRISPDRETIFEPVDIGERRRVVQILLTNVQKANEGIVSCTAVNRMGSHASVSYVLVGTSRLSWESVIDITLTAFVSCFVAVVIVALIVWACVTRRRRHTRLGGRGHAKSSDDGSARSGVSNASSRQPSKSPSTSTGAESLLAFEDKTMQSKQQQQHHHHHHVIPRTATPIETTEEDVSNSSNVRAKLLAATDSVGDHVVSPVLPPRSLPPQQLSLRNGANNSLITRPTGATGPLLVLDECQQMESSVALGAVSGTNYLEKSLLMKTTCHKELPSRPVTSFPHQPANAPKPTVPPKPASQRHGSKQTGNKIVKSTLTPRLAKVK